jgi:hypothetical protein
LRNQHSAVSYCLLPNASLPAPSAVKGFLYIPHSPAIKKAPASMCAEKSFYFSNLIPISPAVPVRPGRYYFSDENM